MSIKAIETREGERDRRISILEEEFKEQRQQNDQVKNALEDIRLAQMETRMDVGFIKAAIESLDIRKKHE